MYRGFNRKTRSMLNLAMLTAMGRWAELEVHTLGALNTGVTEQEIAEVLLQAGVYAGVPVASEGFRAAFRVIEKHRQSLTPVGSAGWEVARFPRSHEQDVMSWNSHFD